MRLVKNLVGVIAVGCFALAIGVKAQGGNTISGYVFGNGRQPIESITVELLDDFSRTISRVRTNSTGRYFFNRMPAGIYKVRVLPLGTNYTEQEVRIEIQNLYRDNGAGQRVATAFAYEQRDFYLRLDRKKQPTSSETVFAQSVPEGARRLYIEGIDLLSKKKNKQGYKKLISAIEAFPDYYLATEKLCLEYVGAQHYKAASILCQRAVQIHAKSYKGWYGLAFAFYSLDLNKDALKASRKASTLNPASVDSLLLTGTLFRRNSKYKESEEHLTKAKKLAKNSKPEIHWELALLYGKNMKRYKDAADELEIFLKLFLERKSKDKDIDQSKVQEYKDLIKDFRKKSQQS